MGDHHPDREDQHAEPGCPRPQHIVGARECSLGRDADGPDARDDAEGEQAELRAGPDEPAGAGNHLTLRQLQEGGGEGNPGDKYHDGGDHRAEPGVGHIVLHRERRSAATRKAARTGMRTSTGRLPRPSRRNAPTSAPNAAAAATSCGAGGG